MDCHSDYKSSSITILRGSYLPKRNQEYEREEKKERQEEQKKQSSTYGKYIFTSVICLSKQFDLYSMYLKRSAYQYIVTAFLLFNKTICIVLGNFLLCLLNIGFLKQLKQKNQKTLDISMVANKKHKAFFFYERW